MDVSQAFFVTSGIIASFLTFLFWVGRGQRLPVRLRLKENIRPQEIRSLNVRFMHNGHDFDAYQVLGIPAGSSYQEARKAFEIQVNQASEPVRELLLGALSAVQRENQQLIMRRS